MSVKQPVGLRSCYYLEKEVHHIKGFSGKPNYFVKLAVRVNEDGSVVPKLCRATPSQLENQLGKVAEV